MDAIEKKFIAQLDSPVENVQRMVLRQLQTHHENTGRSWRGHVAECEELEDTAAQQAADIAALSNHNAQLQAANERWRKLFMSWQAVAARLRSLREYIAFNRSRVLAGASVLAMAAVGFNFYGPGTGPAAVAERQKVERALNAMAANWQWGEGETEPQVHPVAGLAYWVIGRGYTETDLHADASGQPVEMHCIQIYAKPAVADSGAYLKPASRTAPFGSFSWPERATSCRPSTIRKAEK